MSRESIIKKLSYRKPMQVTRAILYPNENSYPICPGCGISFEREYQAYCDRCGQCLGWDEYENVELVFSLTDIEKHLSW